MGRWVELSRRMQAVADMVSYGNRVCDVGCDHGYVSIYLVQAGISPRVLAMDVNQGPLMRAKEHVAAYEQEAYIELRLSDGLSAYRIGEADSLLCAGMGGRLLRKILEREPEKTESFQELILQPQSELKLFRKFLREKGYSILTEDMILEDGKFYPIIKAGKGITGESCGDTALAEEAMDLLGPCLLENKNPVLLAYIRQEIRTKEEILMGLKKQEQKEKLLLRKQEIEKELALFNYAVQRWY